MGEASRKVASERRTDPQSLRRLLQYDIDWIVMKALEKDRTRRYATASELATDIRRYLRNEPVEARPPSPAYLFTKFVRRNRKALIIAAALLLAAAGAISAQTYLDRASRRTRSRGLLEKAATIRRES